MNIERPHLFSKEEKQVYAFLMAYEFVRRQHGQKMYAVSINGVVTTAMWKQAGTVVKYLLSKDLKITLDATTWTAFIAFVFENLKPRIPAPGQMCNDVLFKKFMTTFEVETTQIRSKQQIADLYNRVLHDSINTADFLKFIGLYNG